MTAEEIRNHFSAAKSFVKTGNNADKLLVIASLRAISNHVKSIYASDVTALEKAKCRVLFESFDDIIDVIERDGLCGNKVRAFFGLAPSTASTPSFDDIARGKYAPKNEGATSTPTPSAKSGNAAPAAGVTSAGSASRPTQKNGGSVANTVPSAPVRPAPNRSSGGGEDKASLAPESLREFIGQQHVVRPLLKEINIANNEGRKSIGNILLLGNPGLGKSTLMGLIAKELDVNYEFLDCGALQSKRQEVGLRNFLRRIAASGQPTVVAFDEIHLLTKDLQAMLLTVFQTRTYTSAPDDNGVVERIPMNEVTFIGATTDDQKLLETIKDRCREKGFIFQLEDYSPDDLRRIYKNKFAAFGIGISDEAIEECVPRSRFSLRCVGGIVEGLKKALYNDEGYRISTYVDLDTALAYFNEKGIDRRGLEPKDREILRALKGSKGMGIGPLSAKVGLDSKKYESEYERFLIKIGFINVNSSGRSLTEEAIKYLNEEDPDGGNSVGDLLDPLASEVGESPVAPADDTATVSNDAVGAVPSESETTDETPVTSDPVAPTTDDNAPKDVIDEFFG